MIGSIYHDSSLANVSMCCIKALKPLFLPLFLSCHFITAVCAHDVQILYCRRFLRTILLSLSIVSEVGKLEYEQLQLI